MEFIAFTKDYETIFEAENISDARKKMEHRCDMSHTWHIRELKKHIAIKQEIAALEQKIAAFKSRIKQLKKKLEAEK